MLIRVFRRISVIISDSFELKFTCLTAELMINTSIMHFSIKDKYTKIRKNKKKIFLNQILNLPNNKNAIV